MPLICENYMRVLLGWRRWAMTLGRAERQGALFIAVSVMLVHVGTRCWTTLLLML